MEDSLKNFLLGPFLIILSRIRVKIKSKPFCSTGFFLYYLKTSENHSGCIERDQLHKWVNDLAHAHQQNWRPMYSLIGIE